MKFQKGHKPWNKGKTFLAGSRNPMYGKHHSEKTKKKISKENINNPPNKTSFKKGHKLSKGIKNANFGKTGKLNPFYGKQHTKEVKKELSKLASKRILEKNPNWQGGLSFELYGLEFDNELREKIRQRDNCLCQFCFKHQDLFNRKLSIHHIDYNKKNCNPNNLISLCVKCHIKTNKNRIFWQRYFTMYQFIRLLPNKMLNQRI